MSEASVFMYENKILKIQGYKEEAENEYRMLQYLKGKLPVPSIYAHEISDGRSYLLMSKCAGKMACFHEYMNNPAELLQWLYENQPEEELVLSHGDYCLPNIFGIHDEVTGYINLDETGIYSGKYKQDQSNAYTGYDELLLFRELGIDPNWEKIRYYILLDELF